MKTALVIPHYYEQRRLNIDRIVESVKKWSRKPDKIYVLVNDPCARMSSSNKKEGDFKELYFINSEENFGSIGRYGIALLSDCDQFVFQDDDLELGEKAFENLISGLEAHPDSVIGMIGGNWVKGKTYAEKESLNAKEKEEIESDFVLGRVSCASRATIAKCFALIECINMSVPGFNRLTWCHEDIPISFAVTILGDKNYLIEKDFKELASGGVGLEHKPEHYEVRDKIKKIIEEKGHL